MIEDKLFDEMLNSSAFKRLQILGLRLNENQKKFDVLSIYNDLINENAWSRLIAYLLNSKKFGCISKSFLIEILKQKEDYQYAFAPFINLLSLEEIETVSALEWGTEEQRRIDILVRLINKEYQTKAVIAIENKIDSNEQINQICDYQNYLVQNFPNFPKILIYLTPDGRKPLTADSNSKCSNYSFSYNDISKACSLLEQKSIGQAKTFISILKNYMDKTAKNEAINLRAKKLVHSIHKEENYRQAIKLILQYSPNLKSISDEVTDKITTNHFFKSDFSSYNHPKTSLNPNEYKICINELSEIIKAKNFNPHYILRCENQNPDYQDSFTLRIALWNTNPKYKDATSKKELKSKIQSFFSLSSVDADKDWSQWLCIYTGNSYKISDFGMSDVKGFTKLIKISVEETYAKLKEGLKKLARSRI